ncbi:MAG: anti-sigma factor antagonist [Lentisphaerae bacterium]|nr:MAG: anti-sigma factor antagonist [Lentisphaerota bacterium]
MMANLKLEAATSENELAFRIIGRATFACCLTFREYARQLVSGKFNEIYLDLSQCTGMDSTFMGVIAMICLELRRSWPDKKLKVASASETNKKLLDEVGLSNFIEHIESFNQPMQWVQLFPCEDEQKPQVLTREDGQLILEAHKTLMGLSEENVKKFDQVVKTIENDLENRS